MNAIIKINELCYKTGKNNLLNHINWEVNEGEHWFVFGLNGSGKTTLLSIIAGYKSPTSGTLEILGEPYTSENIFSLRQQIGWVSNSFFGKYYNNETVLQIVLSGLSGTFNINYDISDADVRKAKKLLREFKMAKKIDLPFRSLSKGEQQNVLISRALISAPRILVLDEPCTGLDIYAREHMKSIIKCLVENDIVTVLYVTHYLEEIQPFMNKTLLLKNGRVYTKGDTDKVMNDKNLSMLIGEEVSIIHNQNKSINIHINASSNIKDICYGK